MHLTHVSSMLSYLILLGGILTIAVTLYMVVISYSPLPYWDGWAEIYFASSGGIDSLPRGFGNCITSTA